MRLFPKLTCAAALSLGACGQDALEAPPSGATAVASCTATALGSVTNCRLLQSSAPESRDWFLELMGKHHIDAEVEEGTPVHISLVVYRGPPEEDAPPAR